MDIKNALGFVLLMLVRAVFLAFTLIFAVIGLIICAPFPSFWREILNRESVHYGPR